MDTEGIDDTSGPEKEVSPMFVLSALISSLQLFNLKEEIASKDQANLGFLSKFAKATQLNNIKIFQVITIVDVAKNVLLG